MQSCLLALASSSIYYLLDLATTCITQPRPSPVRATSLPPISSPTSFTQRLHLRVTVSLQASHSRTPSPGHSLPNPARLTLTSHFKVPPPSPRVPLQHLHINVCHRTTPVSILLLYLMRPAWCLPTSTCSCRSLLLRPSAP